MAGARLHISSAYLHICTLHQTTPLSASPNYLLCLVKETNPSHTLITASALPYFSAPVFNFNSICQVKKTAFNCQETLVCDLLGRINVCLLSLVSQFPFLPLSFGVAGLIYGTCLSFRFIFLWDKEFWRRLRLCFLKGKHPTFISRASILAAFHAPFSLSVTTAANTPVSS